MDKEKKSETGIFIELTTADKEFMEQLVEKVVNELSNLTNKIEKLGK